MKISIVVIGDELLLGRVTDTNSGFIARTVETVSWQVGDIDVVGDNAADISSAIRRAMDHSSIVITTGGLGPTKDDITKSVLCDIFGGTLHFDAAVMENVSRVMAARGRAVNDLTRTQAMVPDSCTVIQNSVGTAPVMWFERDGRVLVALPGVPFELEQMFASEIMPRLIERFSPGKTIAHHFLTVAHMSESAVAERIAEIEASLPPALHIAYLPSQGYVRLRIDSHGDCDTTVDDVAERISHRLGDKVLYHGDLTPAQALLRELEGNAQRPPFTVATAESCTGGSIAHMITLTPGSSAAMMGGVVAYSNDVKHTVLGVDVGDIEHFGAVSIPVVEQMAAGVCRVCHARVGIATSGIAGPGGGTPDKPVGTVCIAVATPRGIVSQTCHFAGNRQRVINHATNVALVMAIEAVRIH